MAIAHDKAHKRSQKGWDTRRRHNPNLANIHNVGKNQYEWRRANGDTVPISGLGNKSVANIAPALHQSDKHLKYDQHLKVSIRASSMPFTSIFVNPGGSTRNTSKGHKILINKKYVDTSQGAGILAHELGHAVGPGPFNKEIFPEAYGVNRANEFGKAFQWKTPRSSYNKDLKRNWKKKRTHPAKGRTRQGVNQAEDFAETYRAMIGVPIKGKHFKVVDTKDHKRASYMRQYHLQSQERRV